MYCIEINRPEAEFWSSSMAKVLTIIDMYADEMQMRAATINQEEYKSKYFGQREEVRNIKSMKEIEGW